MRVLSTSETGTKWLRKVNKVDDIWAGSWINNSIFSSWTHCSLIWNNFFAFLNVLLGLGLVLEASWQRSNIVCFFSARNRLQFPPNLVRNTWAQLSHQYELELCGPEEAGQRPGRYKWKVCEHGHVVNKVRPGGLTGILFLKKPSGRCCLDAIMFEFLRNSRSL